MRAWVEVSIMESSRRSIPLPCEVDAGKTEATFEKGVLAIMLPKAGAAWDRQRIVVKSGEGKP